jgi:hypothetical protein
MMLDSYVQNYTELRNLCAKLHGVSYVPNYKVLDRYAPNKTVLDIKTKTVTFTIRGLLNVTIKLLILLIMTVNRIFRLQNCLTQVVAGLGPILVQEPWS